MHIWILLVNSVQYVAGIPIPKVNRFELFFVLLKLLKLHVGICNSSSSTVLDEEFSY